ncbi:TGF-beta-activated kinase 1 and MAP3K7-binding protein 1-like isoform X2 [Oratosquilla oratoria]|uniref:TGF-beta-activated kinase 1 and MAP3K7-binding protein 1-like isoform X2 n=1 Tax=Oratosquilla oratoria TaxID=337810 RepID=UPI003F767BC1
MPSQALKQPALGMAGMRHNDTWTDGLPICKLSGCGMSANQIYREDGTPFSAHEYEDRSIHFALDKENYTYLYGVFDGHDGAKAAYFASQRMPAELSFEQLTEKNTEEEVKAVFRDAFLAVENGFLESIDPKIAERTQLLDKIPDGMSQFEAAQKYPETFSRLQALEQEVSGGTTAVVALIHRGMLYVGNVGDSRALLCWKDRLGVLKVKQLSADHNTSSHDELQRLSNIGLDICKIKGAKLGNHDNTRCIGSYFIKGGYKEFDMLSDATAEPVISEPHITSIPIDESCRFLLLMSDGLYKSYEEAKPTDQVNKEIAQMVVEQFVEQPTLTSVAQTVVDKVVRMHHDMYLTKQSNITTRDDITLIIRNFNFPLRQAHTPSVPRLVTLPNSPSRPYRGGGKRHRPHPLPEHLRDHRDSSPSSLSGEEDTTICNNLNMLHAGEIGGNSHGQRHLGPRFPGERNPGIFHMPFQFPYLPSSDPSDPGEGTDSSYHHTDTNTTSTESSDFPRPSLTQLPLDQDGLIQPYVNFDLYYQAIDEAISKGLIPESSLHLYK